MNDILNYKDVLLIFLIPFGGGIPGGVLLAKSKGMEWPIMMTLYFISDVILALAFEPLMILFIKLGKKSNFFSKIGNFMKSLVQRTLIRYGNKTGIFALIMIAFGVDPMTGRGVAAAAGHGAITGWMIAIAGDMIYFTLLMISTLWLNSLLGNATVTMVIILIIMFLLPNVMNKTKQ